MVNLTLPWPPTVNLYWRPIATGRTARLILTKAARKYRANALAAILSQQAPRFPADTRLAVTITLHPPDRRKRDVDNFNKGILDALTFARVYADDSQIDDLRILRGSTCKGGLAHVRITTHEPE